jgi:hypothetical protein
MDDKILSMWTIFDHPRDYPDKIVVRRFEIGPGWSRPAEVWALTDTLEEARATIPEGRTIIPRDPADDYNIIESWL